MTKKQLLKVITEVLLHCSVFIIAACSITCTYKLLIKSSNNEKVEQCNAQTHKSGIDDVYKLDTVYRVNKQSYIRFINEVKANKSINEERVLKAAEIAAIKYDVGIELLLIIASIESNFNAKAEYNSCYGIMQMFTTDKTEQNKLYSVEYSMLKAAKYLKDIEERINNLYSGMPSEYKTLAVITAYNSGVTIISTSGLQCRKCAEYLKKYEKARSTLYEIKKEVYKDYIK